VRRAYKLRAYLTRPQEGRAARLLADHCDLNDAALAERREAWRMQRIRVMYGDQSAQLKEIRAADQVLFVAGDGARWEPAGDARWASASFQAVGRVKVNQHRPVLGRVKTLQLKREGRCWFVIVVTDSEPVPLPPTGRSVGVDLGVARFLTTSDGEIVANPRFLDAAQERIADLQRRKARTRLGSGNRRRLRRALAKQWRTVRNQRRDFHHRTARALVESDDEVALEELHVDNLTASARGRVDMPGCNVAAKAGLNRSILDADLNGARNIATRAGLGSGQAPAA
jgi:putative transposase